MPIHLTRIQADITNAINEFPAEHHADFFAVRGLAKAYLAVPISPATVSPLDANLRDVLIQWGAGKRGAPQIQPLAAYSATLSDPTVRSNLQYLAALS